MNFSPATPAPITLTSTSGTALTPLGLAYSGGSGSGVISYAVEPRVPPTVRCRHSTTVTAPAGTCSVEVNQASDGDYAANSSGPTTVTFSPATQTPRH